MIKISKLTNKARELLSFSPLQYMFDAVEENPKLAVIYVDDEKEPKCCALLLGHYLFLNNAPKSFLIELYNTVFSKDKQKAMSIRIVFYDENCPVDTIKELFLHVYDNTRSVYKFSGTLENKGSYDRVTPITESLLNSDFENTEMIIEEVMGTATYDSMKDFCTRGIGYTFVDQNKICGFCTSEYPSRSSLAIGIETDENHQHQGFATEMTKAFLKNATDQGINVYWECWEKNEASYKTALKCGFKKVADYKVLFINMID